MLKKDKRTAEEQTEETVSPKKLKKSSKKEVNLEKPTKKKSKTPKEAKESENVVETTKTNTVEIRNIKEKQPGKFKSFNNNAKGNKLSEKPTDWVEFKKKKKEVQIKRKQGKSLYELSVQAKKIGENLRRKTLKGGEEERKKLTTELHSLLGGQGNYPKLVMTHDMARIVQYLLKFGSETIRKEIAQELIPITIDMIQSKYAKFCVKRMLKYGNNETRQAIMKACYGNAVKLASHAISAPIFEYGYATWATALQKRHLVQEFYGDMYKQSKDDSIAHLRDIYEKSPDMKDAVLGATKANLQRILNKELLDSHLVQTVIMQYLQECNSDDKAEMISQLASHVVILSNSKEGSRAAMICIWQGTNKDRKQIMRALKEHIIPLSKHEHGHCTIITLLDAADDTVIVNKMLLGEVITNASELAADEWGRKVLLWLVSPADPIHFHPTFVSELNQGKENSTSKKATDVRRKELLNHIQTPLLKQIPLEPSKWLANSSISLVTLAILKAGSGKELKTALESIANQIIDPNWKIKEDENEISGIEHAGLHMMLKKLIQHDKIFQENEKPLFGESLVEVLEDEIVKTWVQINRACFLLVAIMESNPENVQEKLKELLKPHLKLIKKQSIAAANILLKKFK